MEVVFGEVFELFDGFVGVVVCIEKGNVELEDCCGWWCLFLFGVGFFVDGVLVVLCVLVVIVFCLG